MLSLLQIQYFYHLAQTENISRAARDFGISQTALSSMINKLEEALDTKLFDRSQNTLRLNEAGRTFLQTAETVVQALESGQQAVKDIGSEQITTINLAVRSLYVWQDLLVRFQKLHPEYHIRLFDLNSSEVRQRLTNGKLDLAILGTNDESPVLTSVPIGSNQIYLVVPPGHPLASRQSVRFEDFANETFIGTSGNTGFVKHVEHLFKKAGITPRYKIQCDYLLRAPLVADGFGVAVTTSRAKASNLLAPNLYIPITDSYASWQLYLVWNTRRYMSRAATEFKNYLLHELNGSPDQSSIH